MGDCPVEKTGTRVDFQPDPEIFEETEFDFDTLKHRLREMAFLTKRIRIILRDDREDEPEQKVFHYEGGIREFVTFINRSKDPLHPDVIYMSGNREDSMAEVALQYNDSYNEVIVSFANNVHTPEGGMHETGFKAALTRVLSAYGIKYGIV